MRQNGNISQICNIVVEIRNSTEKINDLLCFGVFMKIVLNGMLLSSGFCTLADNLNRNYLNYTIIAALILMIIGTFLDMMFSCYSSQAIFDSMEELCQTTETRLSKEEVITSIDKQQIDVILSFRKRIRFSAARLFDLRSRTVLSIVHYAATYAIILIQTE